MLKKIKIETEIITLGQLLKLLDIISSGGQATLFLSEHKVYVNGKLENRRGKKLFINDEIIIDNITYKVVGNDD